MKHYGPVHPMEAHRRATEASRARAMTRAAAVAFTWEYMERRAVMFVSRAIWNGWRSALIRNRR